MNEKRAEEKEFFEKIKKISKIDLFGIKKEIKYLRKILYNNEKVLGITSGILEDGTWIVACTNKRVLFINCGMIYGVKHSEILIEKVNAVSFKNGIMNGEIHIEDGASTRIIKNVPKYTTQPFTNSIRMAIELTKKECEKNQNSTADELIKFKQLLEDGVITQEEFENQKKKLLK